MAQCSPSDSPRMLAASVLSGMLGVAPAPAPPRSEPKAFKRRAGQTWQGESRLEALDFKSAPQAPRSQPHLQPPPPAKRMATGWMHEAPQQMMLAPEQLAAAQMQHAAPEGLAAVPAEIVMHQPMTELMPQQMTELMSQQMGPMGPMYVMAPPGMVMAPPGMHQFAPPPPVAVAAPAPAPLAPPAPPMTLLDAINSSTAASTAAPTAPFDTHDTTTGNGPPTPPMPPRRASLALPPGLSSVGSSLGGLSGFTPGGGLASASPWSSSRGGGQPSAPPPPATAAASIPPPPIFKPGGPSATSGLGLDLKPPPIVSLSSLKAPIAPPPTALPMATKKGLSASFLPSFSMTAPLRS